MKKWLLPLFGTLALAACSNALILTLTSSMDIRTEYRTAGGEYVGCDNVEPLNSNTPSITTTLVALRFNTNADLDSAELGLYSTTLGKVDPGFKTSVPANQLNSNATSYSFVFKADTSNNNPLPAQVGKQGIVVVPKGEDKIKIVSVGNQQPLGAFKGWVQATADGTRATFVSTNSFKVYNRCSIEQITTEDIAFN
ncbi:hypothetical protein [Deinococcus cellulosilyticus]|uniref:Lipoprotein n=1 Tax=Deinococcus cellulosilyticus (strain DSM 18568 / NBRC 106333 / KACC 11606 / 5516J-15) TaxID=1223518 RepID=A0A511MWF1_DEIC1|nr:hypothetical protein [Deinococcus cellulosilyticus]GEM44904.1 hypothetical protein DC3_05390 [Deinococcus cellulosilyticus NBRC 106333 = KACC 11606]